MNTKDLITVLVPVLWVLLGALGEYLDREVTEAKSPRVAGIGKVLASVGFTPGKALKGLARILLGAVGVKVPDSGPKTDRSGESNAPPLP